MKTQWSHIQPRVTFQKNFNWINYWKSTQKILFWGRYDHISAGKMPNLIDNGNTYLSVTGAIGSENYTCPNTPEYINADTDYIWFRLTGAQRTVSTYELINYDLQRTPVGYDDTAPYGLNDIFILKPNAQLDQTQKDMMYSYLKLPVFWSGFANFNGHLKGNRGALQQLWSTYDPDANALILRMTVAGEEPTASRKLSIDNVIVACKAANLWNTQFDGFWISRGTGLQSTKMNWIQDAYNLTKVGAGVLGFVDDVGYQGDGNAGLSTNLLLTTPGILASLNDISFGFKTGGSITPSAKGHGCYDGFAPITGLNVTNDGTNIYVRCNCDTDALAVVPGVGYKANSRLLAASYKFLYNASSITVTRNSTRLPNFIPHFLDININGALGFASATEIFEFGFLGKGITPAQFITLQGIINNYIASL